MDLWFARALINRLSVGQADLVFQSAQGKSRAVGFGRLEINLDIVGVKKPFGDAARTVGIALTGAQNKQEQVFVQAAKQVIFVLHFFLNKASSRARASMAVAACC